MECEDWLSLTEKAGEPTPRIFSAKERLFGSGLPEFRFWHDAAGWCPSCAAVWMVLEMMRVPYIMSTGPLAGYMKPGEKKPAEFLAIRPNGVFPVLQILRPDSDFLGVSSTGEVIAHAFRILEFLKAQYPSQACLPLTPVRRACADALGILAEELCYAVEGEKSHVEILLDDINAALSGGPLNESSVKAKRSWVYALQRLRHNDDGSGDEAHFGGNLSDGPFLFGQRPTVVDMTFLPWLCIAEARLPDGVFHARWPAVAAMQVAAREPGATPCYDICFDKATLRAIAKRRMHDAPLALPTIGSISKQALQVQSFARQDAAARVCANHAAILHFAQHGFGMGASERTSAGNMVDAAEVSGAVDLGLQMVVSMLLCNQSADSPSLLRDAKARVAFIRKAFGREVVEVTSSALLFLSRNVSVPRDLEPAPAEALRTFSALVALLLSESPDARGRAAL